MEILKEDTKEVVSRVVVERGGGVRDSMCCTA